MSERMTSEEAVDSVLNPDRWELHRKGTQGPDQTRLILTAIQKAVGFIRQAMGARDTPPGIQAVLQSALNALDEPGSEAKTIPETLAALSRNQSRMVCPLTR